MCSSPQTLLSQVAKPGWELTSEPGFWPVSAPYLSGGCAVVPEVCKQGGQSGFWHLSMGGLCGPFMWSNAWYFIGGASEEWAVYLFPSLNLTER